MKVRPEHVEHMRAAMLPILQKNTKPADVSDKRWRWDVARAAGLIPYTCDTLYTYANDDHIDTALRHIIKVSQS